MSSSRTIIGFLLVGGIGYTMYIKIYGKSNDQEYDNSNPMLNFEDYNGEDNLHSINPYIPQTYGHISSTKKIHADPIMVNFLNVNSKNAKENLLFTGSNGKKMTRIEQKDDHDAIFYGYPSYDYSVSKSLTKKYKKKFF